MSKMRRALVAAALGLVTATPALTASAAPERPTAPAGPRAVRAEAASEGFYEVPDPLPPGQPGDVIKTEQVDAPGVHGTVYRVMYHSQSVQGADIAVTGLIAVPDTPAPDGGFPVISWAHGTTGIADVCAPSKNPTDASIIQFGNQLLDRGYLAVGTDYEGLGTPGRHPYIVGQSEARGTIDIVRAARQLQFAHASANWLVWGHSQGGHAAMWVSQIASTWAPELNLVGTVAGAPPSQLRLVYQALQSSPFRYYILMAGAGFAAAYPELDLRDVATDLALSKLHVVDEGCTGEINDAYRDDSTESLLKRDPYTLADWKAVIDAQEPGTVKTDNPILIIQGGNDEQIPVVSSELLLNRLCTFDQVVERRIYPGQSHAGVIGPSFAAMLTWIDDRFAGQPALSVCENGEPVTLSTVEDTTTTDDTTTTTTDDTATSTTAPTADVDDDVDDDGVGGNGANPAGPAVPVTSAPNFTG